MNDVTLRTCQGARPPRTCACACSRGSSTACRIADARRKRSSGEPRSSLNAPRSAVNSSAITDRTCCIKDCRWLLDSRESGWCSLHKKLDVRVVLSSVEHEVNGSPTRFILPDDVGAI